MKYQDISKRFRDVRLNNRMTQVEFAKIVGLSAPAIGAIENGLYTPSYQVIRALKKKLGVSYNYLIDGEKDAEVNEVQRLREENERLKRIVDKLTG